ncbi:hypothetical protein EDB92DRAFT_2107904 [Lactarius akahatsu]|uniref:DUF6534 domain-containing protein n=1 Tax=Lactarius akahatsu TaxID=416441 RepID=A0AAD4L5A0_9AGAM|nr:hypothetical protein EDB92DRAFT_2107904 [Lactarius akahatsu]
MPALIPVDNTLGALFIGTFLSSIIYGVTWLQVYSYYSGHSSEDRWPLKSFVGPPRAMSHTWNLNEALQVAFLMLVDTVGLVFCIYTTYQFGITNFGDYRSLLTDVWSHSAMSLSAIVLSASVQHFYAYRIYRLSGGSPYLPAAIVRPCNLFGAGTHSHEQSVTSLTEFSIGIVYSAKILMHIHDPYSGSFKGFFIATLTPKVLCDIFVTSGMVYYLLSNRTQVRRTNNVLNLLAIYSINCGILHLVSAIVCVTLFAKYPDTLIYAPFLFITFRLSLCAFMAILNSRDYLRETLDGPGGVVTTFTQPEFRTGTTVPWGAQGTMKPSTNTPVPPTRPRSGRSEGATDIVLMDLEETSELSTGKAHPLGTEAHRSSGAHRRL